MTPPILGAILAAAILVILLSVRSLVIICPPNRVAVISGRRPSATAKRWAIGRSVVGARSAFRLARAGGLDGAQHDPDGVWCRTPTQQSDPAERPGHRQREGLKHRGPVAELRQPLARGAPAAIAAIAQGDPRGQPARHAGHPHPRGGQRGPAQVRPDPDGRGRRRHQDPGSQARRVEDPERHRRGGYLDSVGRHRDRGGAQGGPRGRGAAANHVRGVGGPRSPARQSPPPGRARDVEQNALRVRPALEALARAAEAEQGGRWRASWPSRPSRPSTSSSRPVVSGRDAVAPASPTTWRPSGSRPRPTRPR